MNRRNTSVPPSSKPWLRAEPAALRICLLAMLALPALPGCGGGDDAATSASDDAASSVVGSDGANRAVDTASAVGDTATKPDAPGPKPGAERSVCDPCSASDQCRDPGSVCIGMGKPFGSSGFFCQLPCDKDTPCPAGSVCEGTSTTEETYVPSCRPISNICACSATAKAKGWSTSCYAPSYNAQGQVEGKCAGAWVCDGSGAHCDAPAPKTEVCDGQDNDCDGLTDEDAPCDDGDACTVGEACVDGACKAGTDACDCQVDADCPVDDACTQAATCDTSAPQHVCKTVAIVVECKATAEGSCKANACDPKTGACKLSPGQQGQSCDADGDPCTEADACDAGSCKAGPKKDCDDGNPCSFDVCNVSSGTTSCQHTNQTGACEDGSLCTSGDVFAGVCVGGAAKACLDDSPCTAQACEPTTGACVATFVADGQSCDDGDVCSAGAACKSGTCSALAAKGCDDGDPCTADGCSKGVGCTHTAVADSATSCDDGNACTKVDLCVTGVCQGSDNVCGCQDNAECALQAASNKCLGEMVCNKAVTPHVCVPLAATAPVCAASSSPCAVNVCDPASGQCKAKPTASGTLCDDGDACTTADTCDGGTCKGGGSHDCDDNNACTVDACISKAGNWSCSHSPSAGTCDDNNACTVGDACQGSLCVAGPAKPCTDGNGCTADSCDTKTGNCVFSAAGSDGLVCKTGPGACGPAVCKAGTCAALSLTPCLDSNLCTDDACVEGVGCTHTPNKAPCSDGNVCTTPDACAAGACKPGAPRSCDDGNPCTTDSCAPSLGTATGCVNTVLTTGTCDDGELCTSDDHCDKGTCVGTDKDCGDDEECTLDTCKGGVCSHDLTAKDGKDCKTNKWCWGYGVCGKGVCVDTPGNCPEPQWKQMWPIKPLAKLRDAITLYDPLGVHVVHVKTEPGVWQAYLNQVITDKKSKTYHKATIAFDGETFGEVGIRPFGFGSQFYNPSKPNIRMNFDYYISDAVGPYKRRNLRLKASGQDRTYLRQPFSQSLIQQAGGNSPRWSWARVFVNGEAYGLYQVFEHVDKRFFDANFGETDGNDYEPGPICRGFNCPSTGCADLANYYDKDPGDGSEMVAFANVIASGSDSAWFGDAGKIVDWQSLMAQYAIETVLSDFDSLAAAGNNYEIYVRKDTGKMQFIPGGMDLNYGRNNSWYDLYVPWGPPNVWCPGRMDELFLRILKTPAALAQLNAAIQGLHCGAFAATAHVALIDGMQAMLSQDLYNDPKGIASKAVINQEFLALNSYVVKRGAYLDTVFGPCP